MAARRLLIAMLALLVISTIAAAFASREQRSRPDETTTTTTAATDGKAESGQSAPPPRPLQARVDVGPGSKLPHTIRIATGRPLSLDVDAEVSDLVSIPRLGLLEDVAPNSPAHFDLLIHQRGNYGVRLVNANRTVATIAAEPKPEHDSEQSDPRPSAAASGR